MTIVRSILRMLMWIAVMLVITLIVISAGSFAAAVMGATYRDVQMLVGFLTIAMLTGRATDWVVTRLWARCYPG